MQVTNEPTLTLLMLRTRYWNQQLNPEASRPLETVSANAGLQINSTNSAEFSNAFLQNVLQCRKVDCLAELSIVKVSNVLMRSRATFLWLPKYCD
jgi:hypothetical protein